MKKMILLLLALVFAVVVAGCGGSGAKQEAPAEKPQTGEAQKTEQAEKSDPGEKDLASFKDKSVSLIVPASPGGGYDTYARLLAPTLQKYLPGSTVIVNNVPGAGFVIGTNQIYEAKPDGLTIGTTNKGLMAGQIAKLEGIRFDFQKFTWLGNAVQEPRVFVVGKKQPYKTMKEFLSYGKKISMGSTGAGTSNHTDTLMMKQTFKLDNLEVVPGFPGSAEIDLAVLRGDVAGNTGSYESVRAQIESGEVVPLMIIGDKRMPELPDVPTLRELAPQESLPLVSFQEAMAALSRPFLAPPGMTPSLAKVMRDAMSKSFADPDLLAKAKAGKVGVNFMDGEATAKAVQAAMDQPPEVVKIIQDIYKQ